MEECCGSDEIFEFFFFFKYNGEQKKNFKQESDVLEDCCVKNNTSWHIN